MDGLTFTVEVIKALAWPLTAIFIFLALRRPLIQLFPQLQRFRYKDLELDFGLQVQELAVRVQKEVPPGTPGRAGEEFRDHLEELAELSPRAVVLEAWLLLEKAAIDASKRRGLSLTSREMRSPITLGRSLEEAGILNESQVSIFHKLRNLRNAAAHASDFAFDSDSAVEYADVAIRLSEYLWEA